MARFGTIIFSVLVCITSLSCQSYTTGLQQSVGKTDEASAIAALHTIATAQRSYAASSGGNYGTFQQLCDGGYLDSRFNSSKPQLKDYVLTMQVSQKSGSESQPFFSCNADPIRSGEQAGRHFYIDSSSPGTHVNPSKPATAEDGPLQP